VCGHPWFETWLQLPYVAAWGVTERHVIDASVRGESHFANAVQVLYAQMVNNRARTACASEERLSDAAWGLSLVPTRPTVIVRWRVLDM
jgi:hypothetical protein